MQFFLFIQIFVSQIIILGFLFAILGDFIKRIGTIKPSYFAEGIQANCDAEINQHNEYLISGSQVYGCMTEYGQ